MSSGAAYSSDPQRVSKYGEDGSMKRESPKSVSFTKGVGMSGKEAGDGKGLFADDEVKGREVRRMSDEAR